MVPIDQPLDVIEFHREEYRELQHLVKNKTPFIVILGERGIAKTAIMKKLLENHLGIYIDLIKYSNKKNLKRSYFTEQILNQLATRKSLHHNKIRCIVDKNAYASLPDSDFGSFRIAELFQNLDELAMDQNKEFVLAIDDVKILSKFQHLNFEDLFAYIIDNCKNTSIVLSSDNEKTIRDVFHLDDLDAPLFGRVYETIQLNQIPVDKLFNTLRNSINNFDQNVAPNLLKLIETTSHTFDNVLLLVNELRHLPKIDTHSIKSLFEKQSKIQHDEFEQFLLNRVARNKYEKIISFLSKQEYSWTQIKDFLELDLGEKLYDKNFSELLTHLEKNDFIKHDSGLYSVKNAFLQYYYVHNEPKSDISIGIMSLNLSYFYRYH